MIASLTGTGHVRLQGKTWAGEFPVDRLDHWLTFYRRLRNRNSRRYSRHYEETVRSLEAVRREVHGE
ncbi:MAG: hypothetical protein RH980_18315 [Roseovarius confluentis]